MLLHHVGSLASVTAAIVTGHGHMHAVWMLVTEFTTPLINLRWWLDKGVRTGRSRGVGVNGEEGGGVWVCARRGGGRLWPHAHC